MSRLENSFGALVLTQAVHSIEEYIGRLWDSFPPTRFVVSLISDDPKRGFIIANICLVAFGIWCYFWPVRRRWPVATSIIWLWIVVETINGVTHPAWSIFQGRYTPGVITAPILFVLALNTARVVTRHQ